jgi:Na+(H+)/acetate symporter ActP
MGFRSFLFFVSVAFVCAVVTLLAVKNFQDVSVFIPLYGTIRTKLFAVIIFSFLAGFLFAVILSLITKPFHRKKNEVRPVPEINKNSKKERTSERTLQGRADKG